jgi:hypothetical protein
MSVKFAISILQCNLLRSFFLFFFFFFFWIIEANEIAKEITNSESFKYDFGTIETATKKFSKDKKIGESGLGKFIRYVMNIHFLMYSKKYI